MHQAIANIISDIGRDGEVDNLFFHCGIDHYMLPLEATIIVNNVGCEGKVENVYDIRPLWSIDHY